MDNRKVLVIIDSQRDFIDSNGKLSVFSNQIDESRNFVQKVKNFLSEIPANYYYLIVITLDTHFKENYSLLKESESFPLHCDYGTSGHDLVFDSEILKDKSSKVAFINKNRYSVWLNETDDASTLKDEKLVAHQNLNQVMINGKSQGDFQKFYEQNIGKNVEIHLMGVASDICNKAAVDGFLEKGNRVIIIKDLTKGVFESTDEVLKNPFYEFYKTSSQIVALDSEFLLNIPKINLFTDSMNYEEMSLGN